MRLIILILILLVASANANEIDQRIIITGDDCSKPISCMFIIYSLNNLQDPGLHFDEGVIWYGGLYGLYVYENGILPNEQK